MNFHEKNPFEDIFKKDRKLDLDICNNPLVHIKEKKEHILKKADEAKEKKDFELEILYLIHYIDIEPRDFDIYDRFVSRVLNIENEFKDREEKANYYVKHLNEINLPVFKDLLNAKIHLANRKHKEADFCLNNIKDHPDLRDEHKIKIVYNYLKYDKKKALEYLKVISKNVNNFEYNYLIEILTIAFNPSGFSYNSALEKFNSLEKKSNDKHNPLIKFNLLMCSLTQFLYQDRLNSKLLEKCLADCRQILDECKVPPDDQNYIFKIYKAALNIQVIILHNLFKLKKDDNDKKLLLKILEECEYIGFENKIILLNHYNSESESVLLENIEFLKKEIDSLKFRMNNDTLNTPEQKRNLYFGKENEILFYYHSIFLYFKSEMSIKKKTEEIFREELLTEDDEFEIKMYEKVIDDFTLKNKSSDLAQSRAKSFVLTERSKTNLQKTKQIFPKEEAGPVENEILSKFEIANYLNFIGWVYYNSKYEYNKAGKYFDRAKALDKKFFKSKIYFHLKTNDYDALINYIENEINDQADDEVNFYLAYAYFHQGNKMEAINTLNKLTMLNGMKDSREICENFCDFDLEYDIITKKFKRNRSKYEFVQNYIIGFDENFIINDVCDVVLDIRLRLETNKRELKFNNEYFFLFKSIVDLRKNNEYNKNCDDCIKNALSIYKENMCSNSIKYMVNLLKYNEKHLTSNKIRDKTVENDQYLNFLFDIKQDFLDRYFFIVEYYKKNIFSLINIHGLKSFDFSELNENLIHIYNGNFDKVIKYLNNIDTNSDFVIDILNDNEELNENIISLNASIISLRQYIKSAKKEQKPKLLNIAKVFYWLVYKLYENRNYDAIRAVKLDVFNLLKDKFKFTTNSKHDIVYYLNELNYYLGVVYFRERNFKISRKFFKDYSLTESKKFYNVVKFYVLVLKKIKLKKNPDGVVQKEFTEMIEEFGLLKDMIEHAYKDINEKYKIVNPIEINFHIAQCMYYLGYDYKACLELLNDHHVYIDLENKKENIAFVRDDVYYYKIQVYHKLEKFQEIIDLLDNLEKENDFFKHKSEYVDLINYFRAVSYYKLRKEKDENENRQKVYLNNSLKTLDKITNKKSEIYIDSLIYRIDFNHYLFNIYLNCYLKERKNKLELEKLIENFDNYVKDLDEVITDDMIEKSRLNRIWEYKLFGLFYFNKYSFSELDHFIKSNKDYEKYYVNNDKNRNFVESFYLGLAYFRDEINFFDIFFKKKSKPGISYQENLKKCQNFLDKYKYEIEVNEKNKHLITINKINLHFCRGVLGILNKNYQDLKDFDRAFEISERDFNSSSYYSSEYLIFDKRFELSYYKSIALLKHKDLISAQKNIKKAYDFLSEDLKIDEKLRESIQFINSYIGYKIEKDKNENSYKFDVGLENFEYLKNEVNFYKGKCFLKNENLKESLEHFNSIKEKDPFWRAHVLIKHKVECNYKYGIYNQINEKKHGQKNEHLENTIALIEKNKEKLIEQNNSYKNKNENKNKEVNYDLYKAKCLYYLDNKDDLLYDFVVNSNLQINNDLVSRDLDFLKGVAIMRYKIKTNEMFHYKMINVKQSYIQNSSSAEIKEYIANLDEAKTHLANFLRNQANQNKTDKELEKYDISTIEKVHTAKFYLAIIYQHKCSNNIINSLNHFAEIYRDKVNDVENFGYKNESKISKNRDEIINILSDLFSKLSENETKMNSLNFREFNKTDFCFYFGLALFKSKLYIDNQHSEKLFKMAIAEANTDLSKKMYSILSNFFLGLIYYKSGSFQNAKDCFNQSTSSFILTKFYLQCCEYKIELKKNNGILAEVEIAKMEQIYNSVRNILLEITEINGLENFSEKNLDELLEIMISCFFEIFKNSNEKKNLADNFKQSLEQCKISEDIKIKAIEKYSDRINVLDYYSFNKTKTDLEKFLKNISQKVDTIEKNYYIGIANFKLYEKENDFNFLRESEKHLTAYFSNYSTDKTKINLLLNAKFYLIKCSFERDQYEDLENIEKNLDYINQYWSAKNDDEKYLIDFDENLKNYYLIKTCFYRKNYSQAYQLLLDYTKSEDNLTDEIKYIFNVCLVELNKCNQKSQEQSKEKSEKFDINKSSQYYDNNQIHLAHEYFKLNDSQNCYNLSHGIFNKFFHNSASQKLKNKFEYEKYEYYLLISCMINSYFHLAIQKNDQNAFTAISDYCEKAIKYHEYNKIEYFKSDMKENIFKKLYLSKYFSKDYDFLIGLNEDSFSCLAEYNYLKGASFFKKFTHKSEAKSHLKKYIDSYKLNKIIDTRVNVLNAYYFLTLINFEESVNENEPLNYIINETKSVLSEDGKDLPYWHAAIPPYITTPLINNSENSTSKFI